MFLLVALFTLSATVLFTATTWMHFTGLTAWYWIVAPVLVVAGFVGVIFASFRREHPALRIAGTLTAVLVGFFNYAFVAALASWALAGVLALANRGGELRWIVPALYALAVGVTIFGLVNAAWLRVVRVTVRLRHLPPAWRGREVALVSDIHVGNIRGARFVRRIVGVLEQVKPDAVLIAGDMFDGAKVEVAAAVEPWARLAAPRGIFFVSGNHDEFSDRSTYFSALRQARVRVLANQKVDVDGLQIAGVLDHETRHEATYREILQRMQLDPSRASVLIAHQPSHLNVPEQAGVSLQVSGHTHGGQFWPWTLVVRRIYGAAASGLSRFGRLQVFTSTGAGSWGPPVRVGTRAEIVLIRLEEEP